MAAASRVRWDPGSLAAPKSTAALSAPEDAALYPYGCAKLRMTEMPLVREKKK